MNLLGCLGRAAENSPFITELMGKGELFHPLRLTTQEAYTFLKEIPSYEEAGILCRMPNWWKRRASSVRISLSMGEKPPSYVGLDAILNVTPQLTVDGVPLSDDEIRALLAETEGLAFLKGKWIEVDHSKLSRLLREHENLGNRHTTLLGALRGTLPQSLSTLAEETEITNGKWLRSLRDDMHNPEGLAPPQMPESFLDSLRLYQETGFS